MATVQQPKRKFKLLVGIFAHKGELLHPGKTHKAGTKDDIVETDLDLVELFPGKFQEVGLIPEAFGISPAEMKEFKEWQAAKREKETPPTVVVDEVTITHDKEEGKGEAGEVLSPLGTDVTKDFPAAGTADLLVFVQDDMYFVTEKEDPTKALNESPLEKKQVRKFITDTNKEE